VNEIPTGLNGQHVNWSTPTFNSLNTTSSTNGFSSIVNTVFGNIPWLGAFLLLIIWFILLVAFAGVPGRKKYAYMALVVMILSMVFELYTLVSIYTTAAFTAVFFLTLFFVVATRSE
jgi:hypothetical protein